MLALLKIKNFALIDELTVTFSPGLNLLTGETGSGKSIIVDSLSALTGERVYSELIKEGEDSAAIEGVFEIRANADLRGQLEEAGIGTEGERGIELIVRRDISVSGRNRVFVNDQIVTLGFLKKIGAHLADIHGQGEHAALFSPANHLEILDEFADLGKERLLVAEKYRELSRVREELASLRQDEAQKLQLLDILRFQVDEIERADIGPDEGESLETEKKRLANTSRLAELSEESYSILYESDEPLVGRLANVISRIKELSEYDSRFSEYEEQLASAYAILEDLSFAVRDFAGSLEFSPERLQEVEDRLAEISRLKRKYGGSEEMVFRHLADARRRLENIETAEKRSNQLLTKETELRNRYLEIAGDLHNKRKKSASAFQKKVEANLRNVALEKARFSVRIDAPSETAAGGEGEAFFTAKGFDRIEFYFSANPGESPKPLAKVASGGEASRLMLILKTTANTAGAEKASVFDEVDAGIGGRVAEAVGLKLKELSKFQQVLCVTHHPQVASLADHHFVVEKQSSGGRTGIMIRQLDDTQKVAEIARMLAGETVSDTAREHASEMLKAAR